MNNRTVHVPQAGANPTISKNLSQFPAEVTTRTDSDLTYNIDLFYSQPIRVGVDETQYISYNKMASVTQAHMKKLSNVVGNNMLYKWASGVPTSSIITTTGATSGAALAPSATGTRKVPLSDDFFSAAAILDSQNLNPGDRRFAIIPSSMYWRLINDDKIKKFLEWGENPVTPTGKVAQIAGISLLKRSTVAVFDNSQVLKSVDDEGTPSSAATSDNMGILIISESYVSRAFGAVDLFLQPQNPMFYGDIISAVVPAGGNVMRTNGEGIVALVQTT